MLGAAGLSGWVVDRLEKRWFESELLLPIMNIGELLNSTTGLAYCLRCLEYAESTRSQLEGEARFSCLLLGCWLLESSLCAKIL